MILKLTNNKNTYSFEVEDLNNGEKLFYHFQIPTSDMEDGNYKMVLLDGDEIITEEQVCIGAYNPQAIQYSRGENVYINAPFEANLEDVKEVEITSIETTVLPSEGYDGIKAVEVNAQPIFDEGYNVGNADGIEVGKAEQKALLEPITITENGTYENENGYSTIEVNVPDTNGSYDEGYTDGYAEGEAKGVENAGEIVAASAIDLVATEFRTYYTKYSDNIVNPNPITGIYPNGTEFYDLANVLESVYDTGIIPNSTTKLEMWFKPDGEKSSLDGDWWTNVIDAERNDNDNFRIRHYSFGGSWEYEAEIFNSRLYFQMINGVNHIEMSYADGLWVNGEKIGDFTGNIDDSFSYPFVLNGNPTDTTPYRRSDDGEFGMIKITNNDVVNIIIPTADGFKNVTTDEMLEVVYDGGVYQYINNDVPILDNLIKSVNVQPKIDIAKEGIKFAYSSFTTVPEWADFSNVTNMSYGFYSCINLTSIPLIDTSNVFDMYHTFNYCSSLQTIPLIDTSKVISMERAFSNCGSLQTIPSIDTSNVENANRLFNGCGSLQSLPALNAEKMDLSSYGIFGGNINALTDFGGLIGLKSNCNNNYGFNCCPNLTYQSCINILNGLADVTELGGRTLKVHPNFLTTVGDEISIGVNKGWIITA